MTCSAKLAVMATTFRNMPVENPRRCDPRLNSFGQPALRAFHGPGEPVPGGLAGHYQGSSGWPQPKNRYP